MVSYGAASNLDDLIYLRGVDLAVTQSDVFEYFRTERKTPSLQSRSIEGAGIFSLGGNQLTGFNNLSTSVSGTITGDGSVIKTGSGTLTLSGINSYTGPTIVNAGALIVDGWIAPSSLTTVQAGALLGGSGTVGSTLVSGNVSGTASLAGAVQANFLPGSFVQRNYTILTADGGRSGTFDALTTPGLPANFRTSLNYTGNTAVLSLSAQLVPPPNPPTPPNPPGPPTPVPPPVTFTVNQLNVGMRSTTSSTTAGGCRQASCRCSNSPALI